MKVFISWSGERSKQLAKTVARWLPDMFQDLDTWMSDHDIAAGAQWAHELNEGLRSAGYGIICLTRENLSAPWLLFEAGTIYRALETSRVVPYRLSLTAAEVEYPFAQFQGVDADKSGTLKLIRSINQHRDLPLEHDRVERIFETWWPMLEQEIASIPPAPQQVRTVRNDRELLEEILQLVRQRSGEVTTSTKSFSYGISKELVWKQIYDVNESDLQHMTTEEIRKYEQMITARWKLEIAPEEERYLDTKLTLVERELEKRATILEAPV